MPQNDKIDLSGFDKAVSEPVSKIDLSGYDKALEEFNNDQPDNRKSNQSVAATPPSPTKIPEYLKPKPNIPVKEEKKVSAYDPSNQRSEAYLNLKKYINGEDLPKIVEFKGHGTPEEKKLLPAHKQPLSKFNQYDSPTFLKIDQEQIEAVKDNIQSQELDKVAQAEKQLKKSSSPEVQEKVKSAEERLKTLNEANNYFKPLSE